ncbi:Tim44/TimA family putative adaptor protein [Kordiimonas pumila]|uniref:Tim44/TimA family putative adaptor protein n=1 Tax=Kordiimonas pumila TaxID=2161677 RepID=A0ABV7D9D4_9PROT|nr:Tim44/TimA family putative adaptor protein [Kordiimonas pumila]
MYIDIIIIAMIAGFIILRLRSELGKKTGNEPLPPAAGRGPVIDGYSEKVDAPHTEHAVLDMESNQELRDFYKDIRKYDSHFDPVAFKEGATNAYGMILEAFWAGDKDTLKGLLDDSVYEQFSNAIDERAKNELTLENRLLDISNAKIASGHMAGNIAELTLQFTAEIVAVTRDRDGKVVDGDVSDASELNDMWTFARNIRSDDPAWMLVATRTG